MAGLDSNGFFIKTESDLKAEIEQDQRDLISPTLNQSSAGAIGQINGVISRKLSELWQLGLAIWSAFRPDSSSGSSLASLALITGTKKKAATPSIAAGVVVNVNAGFNAAARTMHASVAGDPTRRFTNKEAVTNAGGVPANVAVDFEAETAGPVQCLAGQLTVVAEALAGWNSVTNPTDATVGDPDDTDAALRIRRENELQAQGGASADAIRSDILRNLAANVTHCRVLVNDTDATDVNGVPPHAIEVIARGILTGAPESAALAAQILASKGAGDHATGTSSLVVQDSQGNSYNIGYTWVTDEPVYIIANVSIDASSFPADGDAQLKAAIAAVQATYQPGSSVIAERLKSACFTVAGVLDVPSLTLGFAPAPAGTANLLVTLREFAALDTSRITVNHV